MNELEEFARNLTKKCDNPLKYDLIWAARDRDMWEDINAIVQHDTSISNPETMAFTECPQLHKGLKHAAEIGGLIVRYYYDDSYGARAYALSAYDTGIAIIAKDDKFGIFMLNEDDGSWFIHDPLWTTSKINFIACLSAALSIFNENYTSNK